MSTTNRFSLIAALLVASACGSGERPNGTERSFSSFAQSLYEELDSTPVGDTVDVEIGLFGGLNVMPGENVVMGRYRYRVDSTGAARTGHLSFLARSTEGSPAVPIILIFDAADGTWLLREATVVPADESDLERVLSGRLESWVRQAANNMSS